MQSTRVLCIEMLQLNQDLQIHVASRRSRIRWPIEDRSVPSELPAPTTWKDDDRVTRRYLALTDGRERQLREVHLDVTQRGPNGAPLETSCADLRQFEIDFTGGVDQLIEVRVRRDLDTGPGLTLSPRR